MTHELPGIIIALNLPVARLDKTGKSEPPNGKNGHGEETMNTKKQRNTVATILQTYAVINAIVGVIIAMVIGDVIAVYGVLFFACCLVASFLLYSFGEVIELLHEIRLNTSNTTKAEESDEVVLPEL